MEQNIHPGSHWFFISQQPENCENRNDLDLVQAFLKKWWVELDFKAPNLPFDCGSKVPAVTITALIKHFT
jgi:hypothetical protein